MDSKRGLINFVLIFAIVILSLNLISSTTCDIRLASNCPAVNTVMKLSAPTNAHGGTFTETHYQYVLCCIGMTYFTAEHNASMHTCEKENSNIVLKLSSPANAHAERRNEDNYNTNVCFGYFSCSAYSGSCPSSFPIQMLSLSANTNAHLSQFNDNNYPIKICCSDNAPALCGNSIIESGETCDCGMDGSCTSAELGGATCASVMGAGYIGTLGCTPPLNGCTYDTSKCCLPETNTQFCSRLNRQCGSVTANDNCGISRTVNCGTCPPSETCQGGRCVCVPETDAQFCSRLNRQCGSVTANDNCGISRTVSNCGTCNDNNACTVDGCNSAGLCTHTPLSCEDNNQCTSDTCDSQTGCKHTPVTSGTICGTGDACNLFMCNAGGACERITTPGCCLNDAQCGSGIFCPKNACNLATNTCYLSYPGCGNGDSCCPPTCNLGNDNDCQCTNDNQCKEKPVDDLCTIDTCTSGSCTRTTITTCKHNDGCCPVGCNANNDNDCSAICGNGVKEGAEQCDGGVGGRTCEEVYGSNYQGTLSCIPAGQPNACTYTGCVTKCTLTSASWSEYTPVGGPYLTEGKRVFLNITGTNCGGELISFEIKEKDLLRSEDVSPNPSNIIFPIGETKAAGTWISVFMDDSGGVLSLNDGNPPEYYFIARAATGSSFRSPDAGLDNPGLLRVEKACGNGVREGAEQCDNGINNGVVCVAPCEGSCSYCSDNCRLIEVVGGVCPDQCSITSAYWGNDQAVDGDSVRLNVEASKCEGRTITFEIFKKEEGARPDIDITREGGANPSPIASFPSDNGLGYVNWNAFYIENTRTGQRYPPEYYFRATVLGSSPLERKDSGLMKIYNKGDYVGINLCGDYTDKDECNNDVARVGKNELTCETESTYDDVSRCTIIPNCGCTWDDANSKCNPKTNYNLVCDSYMCRPNEDECWVKGDNCLVNGDSCECEDGYYANGIGYCVPFPTPVTGCDDSNECWVGEHCRAYPQCNCEPGYTADVNGYCLSDDMHICSESSGDECWILGARDNCIVGENSCNCAVGYIPDGEGRCIYTGAGDTEMPPRIGGCLQSTSGERCQEGVAFVQRTSTGTFEWSPENNYVSIPLFPWAVEGTNMFFLDGAYRYNPSRVYEECTRTEVYTVPCPATVELSFFELYQIIVIIAIISLAYIIYILRKKETGKSSKKNKRKHK